MLRHLNKLIFSTAFNKIFLFTFKEESFFVLPTAGEVILESPVRAVTMGDTITLLCIGKNNSQTQADFYKDGLLVHKSVTGNMTIQSISLSDGGRYSCKTSKSAERSADNLLRVKGESVEILLTY